MKLRGSKFTTRGSQAILVFGLLSGAAAAPPAIAAPSFCQKQAMAECEDNFGYTPGTAEYNSCVREQTALCNSNYQPVPPRSDCTLTPEYKWDCTGDGLPHD